MGLLTGTRVAWILSGPWMNGNASKALSRWVALEQRCLSGPQFGLQTVGLTPGAWMDVFPKRAPAWSLDGSLGGQV